MQGIAIQGDEACDDGGESPTCNANCQLSACGDGVLNVSAGEECDEGDKDEGDACLDSCEWKDLCAAAAKLQAADGALADLFGAAVAISGNTVVIGAFRDDDKGDASGSAYVFAEQGGSWVETAKLQASDGLVSDSFGSSVSVSDDIIIVGASFGDAKVENSGAVYLYAP